jgi:hypothetical protein
MRCDVLICEVYNFQSAQGSFVFAQGFNLVQRLVFIQESGTVNLFGHDN